MTHIIRTTAGELLTLLVPVVPHLPERHDLPGLSQVPVVAVDGYLVASATNRYTAGFQRVKLATPPQPGAAFRLLAEEAHGLIRLLEHAEPSARVTVLVEDTGAGQIAVDPGVLPDFPGGASIELAAPEATGITPLLPRLDRMIPAVSPENVHAGRSRMFVDLRRIEAFTAAVEVNTVTRGVGAHAELVENVPSLTFPDAGGSAIAVEIGPDFLGLLMPHMPRGGADPDTAPAGSWRSFAAEAHEVAAAAHHTHARNYRAAQPRRR
ncbi:hypothetical protein GCM10022215_18320 [Nocardioides fonticola]|uniref:DNA polymerase III beta sliding clamp central domain-containing protein n=1 Tax=Nocardioides fonticola TaxID=450363 RepID=A0ABP7XHV4_9ACTN